MTRIVTGKETPPPGAPSLREAVTAGVASAGRSLPQLPRLQEAFGAHDLAGIRGHTDERARRACAALGARAYATGEHIAFADPFPSLHTIAHEATHVIQQRRDTDRTIALRRRGYEQHADAVARALTRGDSVDSLLGPPTARRASRGEAVQFQDHDEDELRAQHHITIRDRPHGPLEDRVPAHRQGTIFEPQHLDAWEGRLRQEGWDTYRGQRRRWPRWLQRNVRGVPQIDMLAVRVRAGRTEIRVCDVTHTAASSGSFEGRPMHHADATRLRAERLTQNLRANHPDLVFEVTWQERYWGTNGRLSPVVSAGTSRRPIVGPEPNITDAEQRRRGERRGRSDSGRTQRRSRALRMGAPIAALAAFIFSMSMSRQVSAMADDLRRRDRRRDARIGSLNAYGLARVIEEVFAGRSLRDEDVWLRRRDFSRFRSALGPLQTSFVAEMLRYEERLERITAIRDAHLHEDELMRLYGEISGQGPLVGMWRSQLRTRVGGLRVRSPGSTVDGTPGLRQHLEDAQAEVAFLMTEREATDMLERAVAWRRAWQRRSELVDYLVHDHYADPGDADLVTRRAGQVAAGLNDFVAGLHQADMVVQMMLSAVARLEARLHAAMEALHERSYTP